MLAPFTAFSEYDDASPKGAKVIKWFAPRDRGMLLFAGVWRVWSGDYGTKKKPNVGDHALFSFLTTEANDLVRPIHSKAMPVVLRDAEQQEEWMSAPANCVARIQSRVLPREALEILPDQETAQFVGGYLK